MKQIYNFLRNTKYFILTIIGILKLTFFTKTKRNKIILMISQDMSISGAPKVLLSVAKECQLKGWTPILVSRYLGPLVKEVEENEIPFIVISDIFLQYFIKYIFGLPIDCFWINTIVSYQWANYAEDYGKKSIWWLHEGETYISKVNSNLRKDYHNVQIYYVSTWVKNSIEEAGFQWKGEIFPYVVLYKEPMMVKERESDTFNLAIVGSITPRKNQIEAVKAIKQIDQKDIRLYIVGSVIDNAYYQTLKSEIGDDERIVEISYISTNDMQRFYSQIDVLICTSTDDPLPVVITEAMMNGIPVITSNCTGHALLFEKKGYPNCYHIGDINTLQEIIIHLKESSSYYKLCSKMVRKIYSSYFSLDAFQKNIDQMLNEF